MSRKHEIYPFNIVLCVLYSIFYYRFNVVQKYLDLNHPIKFILHFYCHCLPHSFCLYDTEYFKYPIYVDLGRIFCSLIAVCSYNLLHIINCLSMLMLYYIPLCIFEYITYIYTYYIFFFLLIFELLGYIIYLIVHLCHETLNYIL